MCGDLGGVLTDVENLGDIAIAEVGGDAQADQLPLAAPEPLQLGLNLAQPIPVLGDSLDARCRRRHAAPMGKDPAEPRAPAMMVDTAVASDADQPRPQFPRWATSYVDSEGAQKGFMSEVFGDAGVPHLAETEPIHVRGVLSIQLVEIRPAALDARCRGTLVHALLTLERRPR